MSRTWKNSKNVEKPVGNRQKYRKIVKNVEKLGKNRQKCQKTGKTVKKIEIRQRGRKHRKTIKMSKTG